MSPEQFKQGKLLSEVTTFGIGGPAESYIEVRQIEQMQLLMKYCTVNHLSFFVLGKGSNTLFDDRGFKGLVIANRIDFCETPSEGYFHVGAGYSFSLLGSQTARQGWSGLEFASGIPGSVGGAIFMNAGANGHETCETVISVDFVNTNGDFCVIPRNEIDFSYRFSSFQKKNGAIVGATFQLQKSETARQKQLEIINYRKATQPYGDKSAGCVFRNPVCGHAGALIDKCGLKGKVIGGAEVSTIHANFIVNREKATSKNVLELIRFIKKNVHDQTGAELESELRFIPYE